MIYFDLDGVLADMESGLMQNVEVKALKEVVDNLISTKFTEYKELVDDDIKTKFKTELESNPESEVKELKKAFSKYTSKVFSVASKPGFYRNLPLMPGAVEMVKKTGELSGELPNILSAPVGDENDLNNPSVVEKKEWVAEHFDKLVNEVIITIDKGKVVKSKDDILIDDRPKYVDKFESAGGTAILYKDSNQATAELVKLIGSKKPVVEKITNKKWIKTFESFRMGRINEEFVGLGGLDVKVGDVFGFSLQKKGQDIEQEIISSLKENEMIKKIISDWSNRFKSSIEKGEITNNQTQTLSGKIYQAAKGIIDVEKGLGLPNSYTYGSILKDVINNKMSDITGLKNLK